MTSVMDNVNALTIKQAIASTVFGSSAGGNPTPFFSSFAEEGNIYRNLGNPIAQNGADANDDILDGFQLPAGAFDQVGRGLQFTIQGKLGATVNGKTIRLWANPTLAGAFSITNGVIKGGNVSGVGGGIKLFDSGSQTGNAVGWALLLQLFKLNALNSQYSQGQPIFGTTHGGISVPLFSTLLESGPINFVVTGNSGASAAGDIVLNMFEANAMN